MEGLRLQGLIYKEVHLPWLWTKAKFPSFYFEGTDEILTANRPHPRHHGWMKSDDSVLELAGFHQGGVCLLSGHHVPWSTLHELCHSGHDM